MEELAGHGARVHTCARSAAELEECRRRWEAKGLPVTVSVCDVSLRAHRLQLLETAKQVFDGKLDILVNNAAQILAKASVEWTSEEYSHLMATNQESYFHLSQLAHPFLLNATIAGGGSIVNISSHAGSLGFPGLALYSMAKGALLPLFSIFGDCFPSKSSRLVYPIASVLQTFEFYKVQGKCKIYF